MTSFVYIGLVVSQLLTFVAYIVVTIGAGKLQTQANTLTLWDGLDSTQTAATTVVYNGVFQSAGIIPYPQRPEYQFQYQWFAIELELFVFLLTAFVTIFPASISRVRPVALSLLSVALVLVLDNINTVFFLLRCDLAMTLFGAEKIKLTQAGLMIVGVANFLSIIFIGLHTNESNVVQAAHVDVEQPTTYIKADPSGRDTPMGWTMQSKTIPAVVR